MVSSPAPKPTTLSDLTGKAYDTVKPKKGSFFKKIMSTADLYSVTISAPKKMPESGIVFYKVHVKNHLTRQQWTIERRYSQFDALRNELWWRRVAMSAEVLPPKHPKPDGDMAKLKERAGKIEAWCVDVLLDEAALELPAVMAFFGLDPPAKSTDTLASELAATQKGIQRVQAVSRGSAARKVTAGGMMGGRPKLAKAMKVAGLLLGAAAVAGPAYAYFDTVPVEAPKPSPFAVILAPLSIMPKLTLPNVTLPKLSVPPLPALPKVSMPKLCEAAAEPEPASMIPSLFATAAPEEPPATSLVDKAKEGYMAAGAKVSSLVCGDAKVLKPATARVALAAAGAGAVATGAVAGGAAVPPIISAIVSKPAAPVAAKGMSGTIKKGAGAVAALSGGAKVAQVLAAGAPVAAPVAKLSLAALKGPQRGALALVSALLAGALW